MSFGPAYDERRDGARLLAQRERIFGLMSDSRWRTLAQIVLETGDPPASISAQLRHLRKSRFGGHEVLKNHIGGGLYQYRLIPAAP